MKIVTSHFYSAWWEASLPPNWYGYLDEGIATFRSDDDIGALHISAGLKDQLVTDEDLREFAADRIGGRADVVRTALGEFDGITAEYISEGTFWREWWLRSRELMIYATYNAPAGDEGREMEGVVAILSSLKSCEEE